MDNNKEIQILTENLVKIYCSKYFKTPAIKRVDISLRKGDFAAVAGPSGSGKSTLLYLLGGLMCPTSGKIWFNGKDITNKRFDLSGYRLNSVSFIFQDFNLIPTLTVLENVEYTMLLQGIDRRKRQEKAIAIIEKVRLNGLEDRRPNQISGGQQQRVAVARAIVSKPKIILTDEPTANLDSHTAYELIHLMKILNKEEGITFLISTHDETILKETDYIYRLHDGKIVETEQNV